MDPWMEHRLRLADRKQLLLGSELNTVQEFAVEMLMFLDRKEDIRQAADSFKQMLAASNPQLMKTLYPEWFDDGDKDGSEPEGWAYDQSMNPEEASELIEQLKSKQMKVTAEELQDANWI